MRRTLRILLVIGVGVVPVGVVAQAPTSGQVACDPHYPGQCLPPPPPDLNCPDVPFRDFPVLHPNNEPDPHALDGDKNGIGCEGTAGKPAFVPTTTSTTVSPSSTTTLASTSPSIPASIPTATLSGASGQVAGELGSFAWPQSDGTTVARIVDYVLDGPNPAQTLLVTQGETLTLRFDPALPVATVTAGVWPGGPNNPAIAIPPSNPSRFAVTLPPGTHVVSVQATFQGVRDGRASYNFKLRVVASTPVEPRPLALTG